MEKMSANVIDIGDVKSFEMLETIGSGAFGVVMVVCTYDGSYCLINKLIPLSLFNMVMLKWLTDCIDILRYIWQNSVNSIEFGRKFCFLFEEDTN